MFASLVWQDCNFSKEEQRIKRNTKRRIGVVGFQVSLPMTHLPRLNHPHLVKALDFWQTGFEAAVVLSYHAGQALDVAVKDQTFSEGTSRTLFYQLISAVSYLHEQGVLHRDVKAENILVSPDHQKVYLADFNTAKALQDGGSFDDDRYHGVRCARSSWRKFSFLWARRVGMWIVSPRDVDWSFCREGSTISVALKHLLLHSDLVRSIGSIINGMFAQLHVRKW